MSKCELFFLVEITMAFVLEALQMVVYDPVVDGDIVDLELDRSEK